jgi:hypothetical protein
MSVAEFTKGLFRPKAFPPKIANLSGRQFTRYFVLGYAGRVNASYTCRPDFWLCRCDCGNFRTVAHRKLLTGYSKSCGCYSHDLTLAKCTTHGMSRTRIYCLWSDMHTRCYNPKFKQFQDYGGRGITMCDRWLKFENFYEDMGEPPSPKHSIDRIDNSKGYSPENCRWATQLEQANNKRNNCHVTYNGKTHTLAEWSRITGIHQGIIWKRLNRGLPPSEILGFKERVGGGV